MEASTYELNIGNAAIAKCSRVHNAMRCALKHNLNSFCSSRMAPHYLLNWGSVHLKKSLLFANGDIMKVLVEVFECCNVSFHCYITFSWRFVYNLIDSTCLLIYWSKEKPFHNFPFLMEFSLLIVKADFDGKKKTIILFKSSIAS
jgi:hypothetical protein